MSLVIVAIIFSGATMRLLNKVLSHRIPIFTSVVIFQIIGAFISSIFFLLSGSQGIAIQPQYYLPIVVSIFLWAVAIYFGWKGIQGSPVSLRESVIQSRLILIPILAAIFLGESVSLSAMVGTLLIVLGIVVAVYRPSLTLRHPDVVGSWYVLAGSVVISIVSLFDKYIVTGVNPALYSSLIYLGVLLMTFVFMTRERLASILLVMRSRVALVVLTAGTLNVLFFLGQMWLYQKLPLHIVYPLLQFASAVAIILAVIFLKERDRAFFKVAGFCVAGIGAFLLKVGF
ncbi:MAG: hypothetical protein UY63_C0023G0002 [Parcubacteria group bacterium GW2011_GWA2_51_10]|nr:MAG: hypothetical protein UY63_C0023G0002 [Parcubacteria group bacterium GW2011_GWA2_51_10]